MCRLLAAFTLLPINQLKGIAPAMKSTRTLALLTVGLLSVTVACSDDSSTASIEPASTETVAISDTVATATADTAATTTAAGSEPAQGGPGGGASVESATSAADLVDLISEAYGEASLGLHRGHQDVESILIEVLGISHDEMHVRMETQGQNLEAVAVDLGIDVQGLIDALVASRQTAVDSLLSAGTITDTDAQSYHDALVDAYTYRVTWNGSDATPTFTGL